MFLKPYSWPSIAYIVWNYAWNGTNGTETDSAIFTGALINTQTILTDAHSIQNITATDSGGNKSTVVTNAFYPTMESMFTVYLGVQNKSDLSTAQMLTVKQLIAVNS